MLSVFCLFLHYKNNTETTKKFKTKSVDEQKSEQITLPVVAKKS